VQLARTSVLAAQRQNLPFPHALLTGAAGLGKTTLAGIIAHEMGVRLIPVNPDHLTDASAVRRVLALVDHTGYDAKGAVAGVLKASVVVLDEAHRLSRQAQELFYGALEDRIIESAVKHPITGELEVRREWVPCFTLLAATNRPSDLTAAFKDRLRLQLHFEAYTPEEAAHIARQCLNRYGLSCGAQAAALIAARGRGVPRKIIGICEFVRDVCAAQNTRHASPELCAAAFLTLGIDPAGLTRQEVKYLRYLALTGKCVGILTLAALLGEDQRGIEENFEPYLIERGYIEKSPRGRIITAAGRAHLKAHHP